MFKIGDVAVYPSHGVGVIQSIENKKISDSEQTFFMFRILDSNMTIMIPVNNIAMVGLRRVIHLEEVPKVYDILKKKDVEIENQTWNRRYREYMQKIKSGSVFEVAEVLRDLFILKLEKDLSFGERKMLDAARNLLVKELSIAQNSSEEIIKDNIMSIFIVFLQKLCNLVNAQFFVSVFYKQFYDFDFLTFHVNITIILCKYIHVFKPVAFLCICKE